jgi:hypothetical protein
MHLRLSGGAVLCGLLLFVARAIAQLPIPTPGSTIGASTSASPTPIVRTPTPPPVPTPTPLPTGQITSTADQAIPVVVTYGEGLETQAQIVGGIMEPIGVPAEKSVTVSLFLASSIPATAVSFGLFDGGEIGRLAPPGTQITALSELVKVAPDRTVRFNFQAGQTLGLYRVLLMVPPKQYLLQFYAAMPRQPATSTVLAATPTPTVPPITTPPPDG